MDSEEYGRIVELARKCPVDYPDRAFGGLERDPACLELAKELQAAGYVYLAKAAVCGISWSRRIAARFDLAYLEADAAEPGWSWSGTPVCTCPVLDGHEVTGSSCPLHGLPAAPWENTEGATMDSIERRLADAKLGAAITNAMAHLPTGCAVQIMIWNRQWEVQALSRGRLSGKCDGDLAEAISNAVKWTDNAG